MILLGVDPGKMTGWAVYQSETGRFSSGELDCPGFVDMAFNRLGAFTTYDVVCESFIISGGTVEKGRTAENWSIEQIGVLRHLSRRYGHTFTLQSPGDAKKFATDARLKEAGWWLPNHGHANDAARHLMLRVARTMPDVLDGLITT